jgi:hypothetical protein
VNRAIILTPARSVTCSPCTSRTAKRTLSTPTEHYAAAVEVLAALEADVAALAGGAS